VVITYQGSATVVTCAAGTSATGCWTLRRVEKARKWFALQGPIGNDDAFNTVLCRNKIVRSVGA